VPKFAVEIPSGNQISRSSNEGRLADSASRTFRIVLNQPGETFNIPEVCNVRIGDRHPIQDTIFCNSISGRYEGDSRTVYVATFEYQSTPSQANSQNNNDPRAQPPDIRPANWSIGSSLYEIPIWSWRERTGANTWGGGKRAANGANDFYDGVTAFDALVTISIQQFEATDPTKHARHVGAINKELIKLGSLDMPPHTVMLRGINSQPVVETWGDQLFRGWSCTYEFAYKANDTDIFIGADVGGGVQTVELGWDVAIPQTGFNVKTFVPPGRDIDEPFGQPLKHDEQTRQIDTDKPLELPKGMAAGKRARAMVQVFAFEGGVSQLPSAQPIALNDNGRPRADGLPPIVRGYQVHRDVDFTNILGLRLF
jgi:hypothetical protein